MINKAHVSAIDTCSHTQQSALLGHNPWCIVACFRFPLTHDNKMSTKHPFGHQSHKEGVLQMSHRPSTHLLMFVVSVCILSNTAATVSGERMVPTSVAKSAVLRSEAAASTTTTTATAVRPSTQWHCDGRSYICVCCQLVLISGLRDTCIFSQVVLAHTYV